jgi:hypothetical protein
MTDIVTLYTAPAVIAVSEVMSVVSRKGIL